MSNGQVIILSKFPSHFDTIFNKYLITIMCLKTSWGYESEQELIL